MNSTFRRWHIIVGQYLGLSALVIASLPGFFGSLIVPHLLIRLIGFMPIVIGLSRLLKPEDDSSSEVNSEIEQSENSTITSFLSPQIYNVAAVAFANGSDNIGIYVPLFASSTLESLLVILGVFFVLVVAWCYAAYQFTRLPAIAHILTRYSNTLVPFVLIGLGVFIVAESGPLTLLIVVASYFFWMTLGKPNQYQPLTSPTEE